MANTINCFHVKIENWKSKQDRRKLHGCSTRFMKDCEKTDFENIPFPGTHTSAPVRKVAMRQTWPSCCLAWLASSPSATCPGWLFGCLVVWLFGGWCPLHLPRAQGHPHRRRALHRREQDQVWQVLTSDLPSSQDFSSWRFFSPPTIFLCLTSTNHLLLGINASVNFLIYCSCATRSKSHPYIAGT